MSHNPDSFDRLLAWLSDDKDLAAEKYENIRLSLMRIFTSRGCSNAEELADATANRVAKKVEYLEETYAGDPALYFYAVARNIYREYRRLHS